MNGSKGALFSMGIWGGVMAFLPQAVDFLSQVAQIPGMPPQVKTIAAAVGGLLAIYGRLTATKKIAGMV